MKTINLLKRFIFHGSAVKCGHKTKQKGQVLAFGCTTTTTMPKNKDGTFDFCLECLGKRAIRCAWCGKAIFIGDPITLYTPRPGFKIPEYAKVYKTDPLQIVGCLRTCCADTGADRAGWWSLDENGVGICKTQSVYAELLGADADLAVIVGNVATFKKTEDL